MTPSKALSFFCIAFVIGIGLASLTKIPQIFIWGILVLGITIIMVSAFLLYNKFQSFEICCIVGFCVLFLVLGVIRFQIIEFNIKSDQLIEFNDKPEKVILVGQIVSEPDVRDNFQRLKVKSGSSVILVTASAYPEYKYLDEVKIEGQLKNPPEFEDFNYRNYLLKDGIYSVMDFPKIELISKTHSYNVLSFIYEKILFMKGKLMKSIDVNFKNPDSEILRGVVFGNDKNMSKDLKEKFNATGLSHITAVSGSNIVILVSILMTFLLFIGFWRGQAFYFSILFVWFYIALIGFPASGVRAAIMSSIFLTAELLGRQNTSSRTIILAGALMIFQNPLILLYDVGFQFSFLASMGIIHLKPIINHFFELAKTSVRKFARANFLTEVFSDKESKFKNISVKIINLLIDIVLVTISAQIFILPIIIYNFGSLSLISLITNLLVLPIIPFLTVFGLVVSILGIFSGFLGWVFALPCYALIFYLLKVLETFSKSWATKSFENIYWVWFLIYYFLLFGLIWFFTKKLKPKFLGY